MAPDLLLRPDKLVRERTTMQGSVPSEGRFYIQIEPETPGVRLQATAESIVEGTDRQLKSAADVAERAADAMRGVFERTAPQKGTVEFALTFEGSAGLPVLAKGKVGATLTVTLE